MHHSVNDLTKTLGTPEDDHSNTFTARLLLLLESKALLEDAVYNDIIEDVIAAYWRDYEDHKIDFMPAFVANDIFDCGGPSGSTMRPGQKRLRAG